ncbi:hypothetical protein IP91_02832 [Pseudoduganella lurida]|uniref:Uncharacterized protein n=2 Tax=Pseudoduganella lurida TaxID=1036180 RepID=A0A562RA32_9BURK|nr:hypothetical protein IP91_02832 [Pseudoduganella lurida]
MPVSMKKLVNLIGFSLCLTATALLALVGLLGLALTMLLSSGAAYFLLPSLCALAGAVLFGVLTKKIPPVSRQENTSERE